MNVGFDVIHVLTWEVLISHLLYELVCKGVLGQSAADLKADATGPWEVVGGGHPSPRDLGNRSIRVLDTHAL